jgi:hypothetical protein
MANCVNFQCIACIVQQYALTIVPAERLYTTARYAVSDRTSIKQLEAVQCTQRSDKQLNRLTDGDSARVA